MLNFEVAGMALSISVIDIVLVIALFTCVVVILNLLRGQARLIAQLDLTVKRQEKQSAEAVQHVTQLLAPIKSDIRELRTGLLTLGKRVAQLEASTQVLSQQQVDISHQDSEAKLYSRAVKMIELGADINEVMRECELPLPEAELLFSLHKKNNQ